MLAQSLQHLLQPIIPHVHDVLHMYMCMQLRVLRVVQCIYYYTSPLQVLTNFVLFINFGGNDQLLRLLVGLLMTLRQQTQP